MIKFITYNKNIDKFIKDLDKRCDEYGITLLLSARDYVKWDGDKSNGYFNPEKLCLATSIGIPLDKWLRTLVHESCHFDQWVQGCKSWNKMMKYTPDACEQLFDWVSHKKELPKEEVIKYAGIMRDLELDCERRTIIKIKKYKLPLTIKKYCQEAGSYAMFYNYIAKSRKWYKIGHEPYNNKKIISLMPQNLNGKYDILTPELEKLFKECV